MGGSCDPPSDGTDCSGHASTLRRGQSACVALGQVELSVRASQEDREEAGYLTSDIAVLLLSPDKGYCSYMNFLEKR